MPLILQCFQLLSQFFDLIVSMSVCSKSFNNFLIILKSGAHRISFIQLKLFLYFRELYSYLIDNLANNCTFSILWESDFNTK